MKHIGYYNVWVQHCMGYLAPANFAPVRWYVSCKLRYLEDTVEHSRPL